MPNADEANMPHPDRMPAGASIRLNRVLQRTSHKQNTIAWSSLLLAVLQSICGAVVALDGLRLAIGLGSLALGAGAGAALVTFHVDAIRVPMLAAALLGAIFNLAILWHVRNLRRRPSAQWRQRPLSRGQIRMSRLQVLLSLTTLLLILIEEYLHFGFHHSL